MVFYLAFIWFYIWLLWLCCVILILRLHFWDFSAKGCDLYRCSLVARLTTEGARSDFLLASQNLYSSNCNYKSILGLKIYLMLYCMYSISVLMLISDRSYWIVSLISLHDWITQTYGWFSWNVDPTAFLQFYAYLIILLRRFSISKNDCSLHSGNGRICVYILHCA